MLKDFVVPATAKMHMHNPNWPPHAKFHNGQTMLMGVFAGTLSLFCLFAPHPLTLAWFFAGVAAASLYRISLPSRKSFHALHGTTRNSTPRSPIPSASIPSNFLATFSAVSW